MNFSPSKNQLGVEHINEHEVLTKLFSSRWQSGHEYGTFKADN